MLSHTFLQPQELHVLRHSQLINCRQWLFLGGPAGASAPVTLSPAPAEDSEGQRGTRNAELNPLNRLLV